MPRAGPVHRVGFRASSAGVSMGEAAARRIISVSTRSLSRRVGRWRARGWVFPPALLGGRICLLLLLWLLSSAVGCSPWWWVTTALNKCSARSPPTWCPRSLVMDLVEGCAAYRSGGVVRLGRMRPLPGVVSGGGGEWSLRRWATVQGASVCSRVICGQRDFGGGAGSAWRRRPPSSCLLSSGSVPVSAVLPPVLLGDPGGCIGVIRLVVAASSFGGGAGDLWSTVSSVQGSWKMAHKSDSLLRRLWTETSFLQSVEHGDAPQPVSHKDSASLICGGSLNRLTMLLQVWCFGGSGLWGCSSLLSPTAVGGERRR